MVTTGIFFVLHSRINFNPHHREGGDSVYQIERDAEWISIHTTAKVVTEQYSDLQRAQMISIHTTAKVVTKKEVRF